MKSVRLWFAVNKRGTPLSGGFGYTRREATYNAEKFFFDWPTMKERGIRIIQGRLTWEEKKGDR